MKLLNAGNVVRLTLDAITVEGRWRSVREAFVQSLMLMAEDTGITTPIHVRKVGGKHVLIDGAHRLEAARRMGLADIAALVVECSPAEARAMEASNHLGAARMTPLQTAVFVASWARDYYARHPDRKPGGFFGNQFTNKEKVVTVKMTVTTAIADALGVSDATVFRALRAGESLTPEEVARLEAAPRKVSMQDLMVLGKIGDPGERAEIVDRLAASAKGTAARVRSRWRAEKRGAKLPQDRVEEAFKALSKLWERAPAAARRRFVEEHIEALDPLVTDARIAVTKAAGATLVAFTRKGGGAA